MYGRRVTVPCFPGDIRFARQRESGAPGDQRVVKVVVKAGMRVAFEQHGCMVEGAARLVVAAFLQNAGQLDGW